MAPAFPAVRALGFFADRDQFEVGDQGFRRPEARGIGQADFDPGRFLRPVEGRIHFHFRATTAHRGGTLGRREAGGKRKTLEKRRGVWFGVGFSGGLGGSPVDAGSFRIASAAGRGQFAGGKTHARSKYLH